ncbi:MAG: hypothetical protein J6X53_06960 [Abditibacteriota bacterium]|nr:hypothetical protein [Abditibacteriota bacterium]
MESVSHECVLMERRSRESPEGGYITTWADGAKFKAYPSLDTSMQARVAEMQGEKRIYSVNVPQDVPIHMGDFYRDETNGDYFHVTSNPEEKKTPPMSQLNLKFFTAEKKPLPAS